MNLWVINGVLTIKMFYSCMGNYRDESKTTKWSFEGFLIC